MWGDGGAAIDYSTEEEFAPQSEINESLRGAPEESGPQGELDQSIRRGESRRRCPPPWRR